jgi:hypothetical protein
MTPEMRGDQIGSVATSTPPRRSTNVECPTQVSDGAVVAICAPSLSRAGGV